MTLWILPSLFGTIISLIVARKAERGMRPPAGFYLGLMSILIAWWCFTQLASLLWINQDYRYFLAKLQYLAVCFAPVLWLFAALSFSGYHNFVKRWRLLFCVIPVITLILAFTNEFHHLVWQSFNIVPGDIRLQIEYGPWFEVSAVYAYAVVLTGTLMMAFRIGVTRRYWFQLLVAVAAPLVVIGVNLPFIMGINWLPIDPTPTGFAIANVLQALAIRRGLFMVVPVARRNTMDSISDGVIVIDDLGKVADRNPAAEKIMGVHALQIGNQLSEFLPSDIELDQEIAQEIRTFDGRWLDLRTTKVIDHDDHVLGQVVLIRDVTVERDTQESLIRTQEALQALNKRLAELAQTDELTGIANRRCLFEALEKEWARSTRYGRPLSLIVLDFDDFKSVNDNYGHQVGDEVLARASSVLKHIIRPQDLVARHGGEEFAVLLPETSGPAAAEVASRIHAALAAIDHPDNENQTFTVTASVGVATRNEGDHAPDTLMAHADQAMYQSKNSGRNRISIYQGGLRQFGPVEP
ncbi:MAG: diguanylate cyclase [Pseudohongiella sp.]|nr:diguanylate cyclase [Pseudohongiella sp.]